MTNNPYQKPYHLAKLISQNGDISPYCAKTPRKLDLSKELWTTNAMAVTCKGCLKARIKGLNNGQPD